MKRFRFRLDTVLRVRHVQEDQAKGELLLANVAARTAADGVERAFTAYETAIRPDGSQSHSEFTLARFRYESAAGAVGTAQAGYQDALEQVTVRRDEWTDAHRRVAVLERLEARRREEHRYATDKAEERVVDDLVASRHLRKEQS